MASSLAAIHTVYSTQNEAQHMLAQRFGRIAHATQDGPQESRVRVRSKLLHGLRRDSADDETWRTDK
eukprot:3358314-Prymnesium_polylepis.1